MRRFSTGLLAVLFLASACGPTPGARDPKKPRPAGSTSVKASSAAPLATGTGTPGPGSALDPARLRAQPGSVALGGLVRVDAAYIVAAGAGNVLSHNGAQIVAAGGGNILSHNGGQLVAAGGLNLVAAGGLNLVAAGAGNLVAAGGLNLVAAGAGNIVAAGGGNLVAAGAGNLVAAGGGNLVGPDGASLVAAGAGNMVAAGAGNLVGPDGASYRLGPQVPGYRLAQAAAPAFGTQLPAAGMLVWVKSLETGNPVPLGLGPDGQPAFAVFTDAAGRYDVHVPAAQRDTVMVVAEVPFRNDRRTGYGILAAQLDGERAIDEDKALVTRYLRLAARTRFDHFLLPFLRQGGLDDEAALQAIFGQTGPDEKPVLAPELQALLLPRIRDLNQALKANQNISTDADYRYVVEEMANVLLSDKAAYGALAELPVDVDAWVDKVLDPGRKPDDAAIVAELEANPVYLAAMGQGGARLSALGVLERLVAEVRQAVEKMGPAGAQAFATSNPFVAGANAFHAKYDPPAIPRPYYTFAKPTDLADFVVTEYLAHPINAPYGCRGPDCEQAWTRAAEGPACHPDSEPVPCLPANGVKELRTTHLRRFLRAVLADAGLPRSHADLMYAAGEALATSSATQILTLQPQLLHVICRYAKGTAPDCPPPSL